MIIDQVAKRGDYILICVWSNTIWEWRQRYVTSSFWLRELFIRVAHHTLP